MKTRILGAAVGIAAVGGLLTAVPAQAEGLTSARVEWRTGAGSVRTTVDFTSRTRVVFRDFTVRDICPGDNLPVRAEVTWVHTDGSSGVGNRKADTNGCGPNGTNFGDFIRTGTKPLKYVFVKVCIYRVPDGDLICQAGEAHNNPYT
ncbi:MULTISPECIES: hypothetical protein [unclassified Kribbella]|uniref:hypothetical protein n=1 Tax=unclassified Kribbella TaxID=2644121 RepID=UPI003077840F